MDTVKGPATLLPTFAYIDRFAAALALGLGCLGAAQPPRTIWVEAYHAAGRVITEIAVERLRQYSSAAVNRSHSSERPKAMEDGLAVQPGVHASPKLDRGRTRAALACSSSLALSPGAFFLNRATTHGCERERLVAQVVDSIQR